MATNNSCNYKPTQYNVLSGGASGQINNISPSTSGYVLTSNGASSQPTFQAISGTASFPPLQTVQEFDDLYYGVASGTTKLFKYNLSELTSAITDHPGVLTSNSGTNFIYGVNSLGFYAGAAQFTVNWIIKINTLSTPGTRYMTYCGFTNPNSIAAPTRGCYFTTEDDVNSGNWTINCNDGTTTTSADSGVAANTNWVNLSVMVTAAGSAAHFYINGVETSNSPLSTNIPTARFYPGFFMSTGSSANSVYVDLCYYTAITATTR